MRNKILFFSLFILVLHSAIAQKTYKLQSPNGKITARITTGKHTTFSIYHNKKALLQNACIAMVLEDVVLAENTKLLKAKRFTINQRITPEVATKQAVLKDHCNALELQFKDYSVVFRAYNAGIAYRFVTRFNHPITVLDEKGTYTFTDNNMVWWGKEPGFQSHNQVFFDYTALQDIKENAITSLPLIIDGYKQPKIVITETALLDYPGMWLRSKEKNRTLHSAFAPYPKEIQQKTDRRLPIVSREKYLAKTSGTRDFPWRIFCIAETDKELITNTLPYILAPKSVIKDPSWIKPGKVAWDWWNASTLFNVDFASGVNTKTYKYYIDFAAAYGLEYILLDEGWYVLGDMTQVVPDIAMQEIVDYAASKNVGVILWCVWKTLDDQLEQAFTQFKTWGIKGIKVDFMNRDDQQMVNYYYKIAKKAAAYELLVDFHGSYKPAGLQRMYPNVLTQEGVNGAEEFKWSTEQTPEHDLILPFGRMLAGPMDYTPGAMRNAQEKEFRPIFDTPMSMGTRCHQLAMFVCYESPLQMLCDSPSMYKKEPACMEFLAKVPTTWDKTVVLEAAISDILVVARQHKDDWYIGGMTDWSSRKTTLDLSFLPKNKKYQMVLYTDGANANANAIDFKQTKIVVDHTYSKPITMAKGGGFSAMLLAIE